VSTQPSSSGSYNTKPGNLNASEKSQITTIGQPLRVLDEEEQEVQFMEFKNDSNPEYTAPTDENKERERDIKEKDSKDREKAVKGNNSIRRLTMSEEISLCPTEHSNTSHQASSLDSFQTGSGLFKSAASSQIPKTENQIKYQLNEFIKGHLKNLANSITNTIILILQSVLGLTKASITISEHISLTYKTIKNNKYISYLLPQQFNTINSVGLRRIIKNIMHLLDNILLESVFKNRYIWLSRHGESQYNLEGKIGGDAHLSERGNKYAQKLVDLANKYIPNHDKLEVWTSTLTRTQETAQYLNFPKKQWKALDELDAGSCDGLTYEEIQVQFPEDFKARDDNKFEYRYPGGESYRDVITRLEPIIMALENQENVLVITHQAVLRCIYAYFMNVHQEESPWMSIPLHTLIRLEIKAYGTQVTRIKADIPAVSTYKEKGTSKLGESSNVTNYMAGAVISGNTDKVIN